ncbi:hypothetical protein LGM46_20715 [Burkholderia arboris]|uniref:hypothetical protein n=1 Tax=Burkholderia arboris TaxID=488730 RepID=UPI001CF2B510|nr:hypothetical protein [Burkholderia arboris]MCA8035392.1 hypothetical protein [Burkholderia arboris]
MKFDHSTESAPVEAFDLDSTYAFVHGIADELGLSDTHDIDAIVLQTANDIGLPDANEACDIDALADQTADEMGLAPHAEIGEAARPPTTRVTASLVQEIHALGRQGIEDAGGLYALARKYGINYNTLSNHISGNGNLTMQGKALIYQAEHPPTTRVTASLVQEIQALGPQGIEDAGGLYALARRADVYYNTLRGYILEDCSLTKRGKALIYQAEHPPTTPVTASLLQEIHALGRQGIQDAGGLYALARRYGVNYTALSHYILEDCSLTKRGKALIYQAEHPPTTPVTASLLQEIRDLGPQGIKAKGGLPALARQYRVGYSTLCNYIMRNGSLTPLGEAKIRE